MITLAFTSATATAITLAASAYGADGTFEIQVSTRKDFAFVPSPIYTGIARGAAVTLEQLNQRATYYIRGRTRLANGTIYNAATGGWGNVLAVRTADSTLQNTTPAGTVIDPAIIARPESVQSISAVSGAVIAGYPLTNLFRDAPVAAKLTTASNAVTLRLETSGAPIDTFAVLNTNLPESATIRVYGGFSAGAGAYDTGTIPFRASANLPGRPGFHGLVVLPAPKSYRFWDIVLTGVVPGGQMHIEHLVLGLNLKSHNHALDKTEQPVNLGNKERTRTGTPDVIKGLKMRRVDFDIALLTEAISETLFHDIHQHIDEPWLVVPNSKSGAFLHDRILYGDLKGGRVVQPSSLRYTRSFQVESLI